MLNSVNLFCLSRGCSGLREGLAPEGRLALGSAFTVSLEQEVFVGVVDVLELLHDVVDLLVNALLKQRLVHCNLVAELALKAFDLLADFVDCVDM